MLIKNIFMELRARLRSCNVYITTGVDFSKNCNLKISIQASCIVLNYYNDNRKSKRRDSLSSIESLSDTDDEVTSVIPIQEFCHIVPNSMSCLKIDKNTISFRILTEPRNGGNFYKELLEANTQQVHVKPNDLKINITVDEEIKITCSNCSNVISNDAIKFGRIRELPSANLDVSDWFCHGHGHDNGDVIQKDIMKPNKNDFFYRLTHFVVNSNVLAEKTNKFNLKRDVYHCNRCLAWLGLKNKDTVKLFNSEVKIQQNDVEKSVFFFQNPVDSQTDDFIFTIESMIKEFNLGFQYSVMCKIVLECTISSNKKQFLLIWVMDKELQVLRNEEKVIQNEIKLLSSFLTKILYRVELSLNEDVEAWLADPMVISAEVSKSMFKSGLQHLQNMSLRVPETFRTTNGYFLSYLKM